MRDVDFDVWTLQPGLDNFKSEFGPYESTRCSLEVQTVFLFIQSRTSEFKSRVRIVVDKSNLFQYL